MKKRLISVSVALLLLASVLYFFDSVFVNIIFSLIGVLCVYEAARALKLKYIPLFVCIFSAWHILYMFIDIKAIYYVYLALFAAFALCMLGADQHIPFKDGAGFFAVFCMMSLGFKAMLGIRALAPSKADGVFMLFAALALGWICDTFAFICGHAFGKKKMCPAISPNKTIAGGIGGVLGTMVFNTALFAIYACNCAQSSLFYGKTSILQLAFYAVMGLFGAAVGIIGDLAASLVKRECGIKDFGNIMPGHGGALDRMDSVLFTCVFALMSYELFIYLF